MNLENISNVNGSMPTPVAVESKQQPTNNVKCYEVSVTAEVHVSFTGSVVLYATDADAAVEKVQAQIDNGTLDDDLEMTDDDSGEPLPCKVVQQIYNVDFQTDGAQVMEEDVEPFDVLQADIKELESQISWNTGALAKHKAFLESLLNDDGDEHAVAA